MRSAPSFLCLLAALAACATSATTRRHTRRRARPRRPPASAAAPAQREFHTAAPPLAAGAAASRAPSPQDAPPDPRCREIVQRNEAAIARVASNAACAGVAAAALRESFGHCAQAAGGAWAAELVEAREDGDEGACRLDVRWRLLLFHRGGVTEEADGAAGRVGRRFLVVASGDEAQTYTRLALTASDLDGDRLPELAVAESSEEHGAGGGSRHALEVYAAESGRVEAYEPTRAMTLLAVADEDGDGRMDFVVPSPYAWTEGTECGLTIFHEPFSLLAHALPGGGFSTGDEVAARYLRAMCPGPDADPVPPRTGEGVDPPALGVVCRRLWGASPDAALAPLGCASFRAEPSPRCAHTTRRLAPLQPGECPAHYERWAHATPPLTLR